MTLPGPGWQNYNQPPQWMPPPPPPKKRRVWPWVVGGIIALPIIGSALSSNSGSAQRSTTTPTYSAPTYSTGGTMPAVATQPAPQAAPAGPKTTFGDGTWVVGEDIVAGTYKSNGAKQGMFELCSVTTHSDENADSDKTLDWKTANANEPIRLKVAGNVKSVKASGCEDFVKVG